MTRKSKVTLSIIVVILVALLLTGFAVAAGVKAEVERNGTYTFCSNVFHKEVKIARVCVSWNISTSGNLVKAETNGTWSVLFYKTGYTATNVSQACVPLKQWATQVVCKSTTKFKENGWPIGGIRQTCTFTSGKMVCGTQKVLAPETK